MKCAAILVQALLWVWLCLPLQAQTLDAEAAADFVEPPYQLGEPVRPGVWNLVNLDGRNAGFAIETEPLAAIPGFSGDPINVFVQIDLEGRFINAELISHNEPIFVSGLGEAPFNQFVTQYKGLSLSDTLVVGVPYGDAASGSSFIYLDGVTKATASVRIAHESILAAALAVARDFIQGVGSGPPARPDTDYSEPLVWDDLVAQGLAARRLVPNAEVQATFAGSLWEDDDPVAKDAPQSPYLDLWIVDVGPPAIARAVLTDDSFAELQEFITRSTHDEPVLVIDAGRHGLVSEDFVRNTSPDWISVEQSGFPVAFRDSDLDVDLRDGVPGNVAMILRTDRRLGFDPTRDWTLSVRALREHGSFRPEIGSVDFAVTHATPERFFIRDSPPKPAPPWVDALRNRAPDLIALGVGLVGFTALFAARMHWLAGLPGFTPLRLGLLAVMTVFIGWWGQGQLSIVTVLGVIRALWDRQSLEFLLYDPFSLMIWALVLVSFVLWGRALFCGWLCPFGALQEFFHHLGRMLRIPQIEPSHIWDRRLKGLKYVVLFGLVATVFLAPSRVDTVAEIEPFKTAITVIFARELHFTVYAAFWLILSLFLFKGFCRYVCPLGAVMAIGGFLRRRDWIDRRLECGSPCQLCRVKCKYGAIDKAGKIDYSECFQCLDCVTIYNDEKQCVPLVLRDRQSDRSDSKTSGTVALYSEVPGVGGGR